MNVAEFKKRADSVPIGLRPGQHAFNLLAQYRPDLSEQIRGDHTNLDPFYQQENLPAFWVWVEKNWGTT